MLLLLLISTMGAWAPRGTSHTVPTQHAAVRLPLDCKIPSHGGAHRCCHRCARRTRCCATRRRGRRSWCRWRRRRRRRRRAWRSDRQWVGDGRLLLHMAQCRRRDSIWQETQKRRRRARRQRKARRNEKCKGWRTWHGRTVLAPAKKDAAEGIHRLVTCGGGVATSLRPALSERQRSYLGRPDPRRSKTSERFPRWAGGWTGLKRRCGGACLTAECQMRWDKTATAGNRLLRHMRLMAVRIA